MSTLVKVVIGSVAALLVLCVAGRILFAGTVGTAVAFSAETFNAHTAEVDAAAAKIADFELPAGWHAEAATDLAGFVFVSYSPGDGHSHIQFVQGPNNPLITRDLLESYAQGAAANPEAARSSRSKIVGTSQATIRGQTVTMVVGESVNHEGEPFRTMGGVFTGKGGPAFVSVERPVSSWDQAAVDKFIASIR